jgi:hypothetical protein
MGSSAYGINLNVSHLYAGVKLMLHYIKYFLHRDEKFAGPVQHPRLLRKSSEEQLQQPAYILLVVG